MGRQVFEVAVRFDIIGKDLQQLHKLGSGWQNKSLTVGAIADHIRTGFAIAQPCSEGIKDKDHFIGADLLIADIDGTMTLDEAQSDDFIRSYAGFIHTTCSHSSNDPHLRIIFPLERRIHEYSMYKALHLGLQDHFKSDESAQSGAQCFFGNPNAELITIGKSLPESIINDLIANGKKRPPAATRT